MAFSKLEQETIINFSEAEATATVYTYNGKLRRRLEQLERDRPDEVSRNYNKDFVIPKGWIRINPSYTREITEEQRDQMRETLKTARDSRLNR